MTLMKPRTAKSSMTDQATAAVQSALRTLDAEAGGVAALAAALESDLGPAFSRALGGSSPLTRKKSRSDVKAASRVLRNVYDAKRYKLHHHAKI